MADKGDNSKTELIAALNGALADTYALYIKTKNFHWHVAGPRFRDLHLMFDEQAQQMFATVDIIAERARKLDGDTLTSIGAIAKLTKIKDQDSTSIGPDKMVAELKSDNETLHARLETLKDAAEAAGDNATSALVDEWIDACEERIWFLRQTGK
ncbi:Dps family protein [Parerythrobacter lacustris]|uniref:DNA starvation/stationary phase protection protein n=1 Tax=Parerythrobacter lacustris TaxID=2969984 RepID=A0ABT1XMG0_9SPHN|nr:DNA starvation/stationary phase protection protein [Parerythrobacter lacustris]MCR2832849.1 DNA starvation/stationary phase protection protein [Parerythrobacter lacustris]